MTAATPRPNRRFDITTEEIDRVVARFYAAIRGHGDLGPIFAAHIEDWPRHEAKIAGFWRNAIGLDRSYEGNPMQVHLAAGNVKSVHFPVWLDLFDKTLHDTLDPMIARQWSALARRIGAGLSFGLEHYERPAEAAPSLR